MEHDLKCYNSDCTDISPSVRAQYLPTSLPTAIAMSMNLEDISRVQKHWFVEIEYFLNTYKRLENKEAAVDAWKDSTEAKRVWKKHYSVT